MVITSSKLNVLSWYEFLCPFIFLVPLYDLSSQLCLLAWLVLQSVSECRVSYRWIGPQWDQIQDVWILNLIWMGNPTEAVVSRDTEWVSVGVRPPRRRDEHWVRGGGTQVVKAAAFTPALGNAGRPFNDCRVTLLTQPLQTFFYSGPRVAQSLSPLKKKKTEEKKDPCLPSIVCFKQTKTKMQDSDQNTLQLFLALNCMNSSGDFRKTGLFFSPLSTFSLFVCF